MLIDKQSPGRTMFDVDVLRVRFGEVPTAAGFGREYDGL